MIFADSDNEENSKNGNYMITIHIEISKKRYMENPKYTTPPPPPPSFRNGGGVGEGGGQTMKL